MSKLIIALYVATTSLALIVLKLGTTHASGWKIDKVAMQINLYTVLGIALYGISFLLYIYLISKYDLGYIIPLVTAFVYILIFTASFFIFKEAFTAMKVVGITLIVAGLVFLNLNR
jgi:drug/metabolite transporter (DMT)-like permease